MAAKMSAGLHPDRQVFVARDIEDEEAVGFAVVSRERRDMTADLLRRSSCAGS